MEVIGRHNPLLRYWASTGLVLVADVLESRVEQHRLVLSLIGREAEPEDALTARLLARAGNASRLEIAELAASQLRPISTRSWLRDLGGSALEQLRGDPVHAVPSALDIDVVVQHVGFRASLAARGPSDPR